MLVVAPPPLGTMPHPWFQLLFEGGHTKSRQLAEVYSAMASFVKVPFFDAGSVIATGSCAELKANPRVQEAYLGTHVAESELSA